MPALIETPEQHLQHLLGQLMWENTLLRCENERLQRLVETAAPPDHQEDTP